MRIAIVTRIFAPEPSAATFRLKALADHLHRAGHDVTVITSTLPPGQTEIETPYEIRRTPVLRDSSGYVRGYVPYMSFDLPTFVRLACGSSYDAYVVEPPPTTGFMTRIASHLRSTPYFYYCADVWADAAQQTGSPPLVVSVVRAMEKFAWRGARHLLSVSDGVTARITELGITTSITTIGNGIDVTNFHPAPWGGHSEFIYAGTASEWHGASVFIEALPYLHADHPQAQIRFIGGGSERDHLIELSHDLNVDHAVSFEPPVQPKVLAPLLAAAPAALASVKPHAGYDFAFPTKMYGAAASGTPIIYAGIGPGKDFVRTKVGNTELGIAADMNPREIAKAMAHYLDHPRPLPERTAIAQWAREHVSLDSVANRALHVITSIGPRSTIQFLHVHFES